MGTAAEPAVVDRTRRRRGRGGAGFTVIEVLIAMGIFTFGFIAIAAPILIAVRIQRETIDDILCQQVERNAAALLRGRKFENANLKYSFRTTPQDAMDSVQRAPDQSDLKKKWNKFDRTYPSTTRRPGLPRRPDGEVEHVESEYYWIPLFRADKQSLADDLDAKDWNVYLFIVRRGESARDEDLKVVPRAISVDPGNRFQLNFRPSDANDDDGDGNLDLVRPGDHILDQFGRIYQIVEADAGWCTLNAPVPFTTGDPPGLADPTEIWIVRPPNDTAPSPIRSIKLMKNVVEG